MLLVRDFAKKILRKKIARKYGRRTLARNRILFFVCLVIYALFTLRYALNRKKPDDEEDKPATSKKGSKAASESAETEQPKEEEKKTYKCLICALVSGIVGIGLYAAVAANLIASTKVRVILTLLYLVVSILVSSLLGCLFAAPILTMCELLLLIQVFSTALFAFASAYFSGTAKIILAAGQLGLLGWTAYYCLPGAPPLSPPNPSDTTGAAAMDVVAAATTAISLGAAAVTDFVFDKIKQKQEIKAATDSLTAEQAEQILVDEIKEDAKNHTELKVEAFSQLNEIAQETAEPNKVAEALKEFKNANEVSLVAETLEVVNKPENDEIKSALDAIRQATEEEISSINEVASKVPVQEDSSELEYLNVKSELPPAPMLNNDGTVAPPPPPSLSSEVEDLKKVLAEQTKVIEDMTRNLEQYKGRDVKKLKTSLKNNKKSLEKHKKDLEKVEKQLTKQKKRNVELAKQLGDEIQNVENQLKGQSERWQKSLEETEQKGREDRRRLGKGLLGKITNLSNKIKGQKAQNDKKLKETEETTKEGMKEMNQALATQKADWDAKLAEMNQATKKRIANVVEEVHETLGKKVATAVEKVTKKKKVVLSPGNLISMYQKFMTLAQLLVVTEHLAYKSPIVQTGREFAVDFAGSAVALYEWNEKINLTNIDAINPLSKFMNLFDKDGNPVRAEWKDAGNLTSPPSPPRPPWSPPLLLPTAEDTEILNWSNELVVRNEELLEKSAELAVVRDNVTISPTSSSGFADHIYQKGLRMLGYDEVHNAMVASSWRNLENKGVSVLKEQGPVALQIAIAWAVNKGLERFMGTGPAAQVTGQFAGAVVTSSLNSPQEMAGVPDGFNTAPATGNVRTLQEFSRPRSKSDYASPPSRKQQQQFGAFTGQGHRLGVP